jgi:predicted P-loop ATPase
VSDAAGDWVPDASESAAVADWKARLIPGKNGPAACLANAITCLRTHPAWVAVLAWDSFAQVVMILRDSPFGGEPRRVTDHEERLAANWLQHQGVLVSPDVAGQAIQVVARDQAFHPVRDYLDGLQWDGTKRIAGWLSLYLGVEPSEYSEAVSSSFLRGAAARIYSPGCKMDTVLILEGEQGIKKSTALKALFKPWFTDEIADIGSKDASLQILGVWGVEFAELDSLTRAESSRIKAFTSRSVERFRPPYGRNLIESPRQCVFAGTVNHSVYLRDETGARRFWPVKVKRVLIDELTRDRDQLWAEAVASFRAGDSWWLNTPDLVALAAVEQAERYEVGPWDDLILDWVHDRVRGGFDSVSVPEILDLCVKKPTKDCVKADSMRVGSCLTQAKWQRYKDRPTGKWRYRPPVTANPPQVGTKAPSGSGVNR